MTATVRRSILALLAVAGVALLGSSVQGVAAMDRDLRASVRAAPVYHHLEVHHQPDCPLGHRPAAPERGV